jgi:dynein heavy chain
MVGVGGSGRRCAATLASFLCETTLQGIELSKSYGVTEWRDDLKRILKEAGTGAAPVTFLFADTQIKWEGMLEDINGILNSGEVPGLFPADEKADICEKMAPFARAGGLPKDASSAELFAFFVERTRKNLHIVLAMSPIGDAFRDRLRKFPSLVNCCTLDWFTSWPEDALIAVAMQSLKPLQLDPRETEAAVHVCQHFHQSALTLSEEYLATARRFTYVTPTAYMELLSAYSSILQAKRTEVSQARNRYVTGLEKLEFATNSVNVMEKELVALQPILKVSRRTPRCSRPTCRPPCRGWRPRGPWWGQRPRLPMQRQRWWGRGRQSARLSWRPRSPSSSPPRMPWTPSSPRTSTPSSPSPTPRAMCAW